MKIKHCLTILWLMTAMSIWAESGINYDGTTLEMNTDFTRSQYGTFYKSVMKEVSGMAASRTTAGYLWAHNDENLGDERKIVAVKPDGTLAMTVMVDTGSSNRDDWEDIATGVYDGKNYIFIGAFGDNDLAFNDEYYIYYFEEPPVTEGTQTISASCIRFGYPDNKAHNTETLMYDNVEQTFYIVDKVKDAPCTLYRLPFHTDYGTGVQRLTEVCQLGTTGKFDYVTAGDITPDGRWMAIKNKKYVLLWERQGSESLAETACRRPVQVAAYEKEEQGESLAWVDALTFYTTSDSKNNTPIFKYERPASTAIAPVRTAAGKQTYGLSSLHSRKVLLGGKTCILHSSEVYTLQGVKLRDLSGLFPEK